MVLKGDLYHAKSRRVESLDSTVGNPHCQPDVTRGCLFWVRREDRLDASLEFRFLSKATPKRRGALVAVATSDWVLGSYERIRAYGLFGRACFILKK